jgi:hypothetical protein
MVRRIRWAGHVALMQNGKCIPNFGKHATGCEETKRFNL